MAAAWLLTLLALAGAAIGLFMGQSRALSSHLAAAGGGLLFGISLFWLVPEIAETSGWTLAFVLALAACCALAALDIFLTHTGHSPRHGVIGPFLAATAVHSFLDGWSVQALAVQPLANVAAPVGLALHKIPEGVALGWVARKSLSSTPRAIAASAGVELLTLAGAFIEPAADHSGSARFGEWWTAGVLAIIAGSFLFLGFHSVLPVRKRTGVLGVFIATLAAVGAVALLESRLSRI